jgi:uncharacterized protein
MNAARWLWAALWCVLALLLVSRSVAQEPPAIAGAVTDPANLISAAAEKRIAKMVKAHRKKHGVDIAVLVVPSTGSDSVAEFANSAAVTWGGGKHENKKGVLYVLAFKDRKAHIAVGREFTNALTNAEAKEILVGVRDKLKSFQYDAAVTQVVEGIIAETDGGFHLPSLSGKNATIFILAVGGVFLLAFFISLMTVIIRSGGGRSYGTMSSSGFSNDWQNNSSSTDFSSGGSDFGGGGGFGGGGASDSW